jgi:hypothetical protein
MPRPRFLLPSLFAAAVCAQQPAAVVRAKLASADPATVAWGAHDAGRLGCPELATELRAALAGLAKVRGNAQAAAPHRHCVAAVLDALIRIDASLPPAELAPWFQHRPVEAIVLAARAPTRHAGLLLGVVAERRPSLVWQAACNLLLAASPTMLVPELLHGVEVQFRIDVVSPGTGFWSSGHVGGPGCGISQRVAGFPPMVWYELRFAREAEGIAVGPQSVGFVRNEVAERSHVSCSSEPEVDCADYALRCLYRLADRSERDRCLRGRLRDSIPWSGAEALRAEVAASELRLTTEWSRLLTGLVERKLLSPDVVPQHPLRIVRTVSDRRRPVDRSEPLPDLAPRQGG